MKKKLLEFPLACCAALGVCWSSVETFAPKAFASETPLLTRFEAAADAVKLGLDGETSFVDVEIAPTQFPGRPLQQAAKRTFGITRGLTDGYRTNEEIERELGVRRGNARRSAQSAPNVESAKPAPAKVEIPVAQEAVAPENDAKEAEEAAKKAAEEAAKLAAEAASEQAAERSAEEKTRALTGDEENAPDARVDLPKVEPTEKAPEPNEPTAPAASTSGTTAGNGLGFADAQKATLEMTNDMVATLQARGGTHLYDRWRAYNAGVRRQTSALESGSELNGRCRLRWYEKLYADPMRSAGEVEFFTRAWGGFFSGSTADVVSGVRLARAKMDVATRDDRPSRPTPKTPQEAIEVLKTSLVETAALHARALAPMSKDDVAAVSKEAHSIFCGQVQSGHTVPSRGRAKYLIDAMQKMNKNALYDAAETLISTLDEKTLELLAQVDWDSLEKVSVDGQERGRISTEAGDILFGDKNSTVWNLDQYSTVCCVVDLGGRDEYREGVCNVNRPVLLVIDLGADDDNYVGQNPGIQGGAILGVSVWYDGGGNDRYLAKDVAQGSCIGGVGVLVDEDGDDRYLGFLRAQGQALCGLGLHIDRGGNDDYRAALLAQGFGHPGGFGALLDKDGNDHYYVGGYYYDSYPEHPGHDGWGQGVGAGIRRVACGGIGLCLDCGGDDAYEFDYFAHGGGYWMGVGAARDFGGNDIRYAATSTRYDGSQRVQGRWQRFGCGFGCHYAVGYLFDDQGDDAYNGTIMGLGMGWDLGAGFLVDFLGDDAFEATGGLTQGAGGEGSLGVLMNYRGSDLYRGNNQGYATSHLTYHSPSDCGANYSFVVDHGGYDQYGSRVANNAVSTRGMTTGFIIDRPAPNEEQPQTNAQGQAQAGTRPTTSQGFPAQTGAIKTMASPPPTVEPPHIDSAPQGGFGRGWRLFGGGM
ncbi:MAG: hypothetical protein IKU86_06710 [Thermoguttaceae bacterium]|nr:hypothetical protein [Thermoguttaceae bacterium]